MTIDSSFKVPVATGSKTLAIYSLAFLLLLLPLDSFAQIACDNDGVAVVFDTNGGVVELNDINVREITGNRSDDFDVSLGVAPTQVANYSTGSLRANGLPSSTTFPDNGVNTAQIDRAEKNIWKATYPKGMYEFNKKGDLIVEFEVTVMGGQASHIIAGPVSVVSMSIADAGIDAKWHGGKPVSLKELKGNLDFQLTGLAQSSLAGIHRADVSLCVNVRGTI